MNIGAQAAGQSYTTPKHVNASAVDLTDQMHKELEALELQVSELENRLGFILRPEEQVNKAAEKPGLRGPTGDSPLVSALYSWMARISSLQSRLNYLRTRVEL